MKILIVMFLIVGIVIPVYAVTVSEKQNPNDVVITITFTKSEFDLFLLDKADPKEWIRNACSSNVSRQEEFIKKDLVSNMTLPTVENVNTVVAQKKAKRNADLTKQGSGVIYE